MTQSGILFTDDGKTITVLNSSSTYAIEAGDIVYTDAATATVLGATFANVKTNYAAGDITVERASLSATAYQTILGVALNDIPLSGYGTVLLEGVFIHQADENISAGDSVQFVESTAGNKLATLDTAASTAAVSEYKHKIGRALTGAASDEFLIWKLTL